MLRDILFAAALLLVSSAANADDPSRRLAPAAWHAWSMELSGELTREAWNYNLSDEDLWGGAAHLWYRVDRDWSIGTELLVMWVHQERVSSTPVAGLSIAGRREFAAATTSYFVEAAGGLSYAAGFVPQRGTRFNFVAEAAAGIIRPVGRDTRLVASLRWLHLSNSGTAGRSRNPDIQAVGLRVGVLVPLRRRSRELTAETAAAGSH